MTIGYEGHTPATFFAQLTAHTIQTLVDIRESPISRKAGFSKSALQAAANAHQIHYLHMRALGCPRPIRNDYREDKDWTGYTRRFLAHLDTQHDALNTLLQRIEHERCCLLCLEADYHCCHRSLVAERLAQMTSQHLSVIHLPTPNGAV
ncbi:MAG: DUF488 domain-containing protein [Chloroflexaceae bacterium]|nr:DUF488 domain-containing protein [Chloroflexaceae bacterium]